MVQTMACAAKTSYHFFKIIFESSLRDGKIKIPTKFSSKFGDSIPSRVELHDPCGTIWKVEVTKSNGEVWLQNGWIEFAEHYSLSHGHLVVFRYGGDGQFDVVIFDMTASEIDYSYVAIREEENVLEETLDEDDHVQILDSNEFPSRKQKERSPLQSPKPSKSMRSNSTLNEVEELHGGLFTDNWRSEQEKVLRGVPVLTAEEQYKSLQMASSFKSSNPFFVVVMQPYCLTLTLRIPTSFVKKYFLKKCGKVMLQVSDVETIWTIEYKVTVRGSTGVDGRLDSKWRVFAAANNLKIGDVCVFELIERIKFLFKVVIYRKVDSPVCFQSQATGSSSAAEGLKSDVISQRTILTSPNDTPCQIAPDLSSESPFFSVVMKPSYVDVRKCSLNLPIEFIRNHMKGVEGGGVYLHVSNEGCWDVKYTLSESVRTRAQFTTNWKAFVQDNKLKAGDVCTFELVKGSKTSFDVVIKRAAEGAKSGIGPANRYRGRCGNLRSRIFHDN